MTLPVACPAPTSNPPAAGVQRKRRRRAPASGATDDCFACAKRNTKCDRRRPYCTPCLQLGKECSGYKTQLTWGVGVASRGKLRGLSLPVARSAPVLPSPASSARPRSSAGATSPKKMRDRVKEEKQARREAVVAAATSVPTGNALPPVDSSFTYDFVHMAAPPRSTHSPTPMEWNIPMSLPPHAEYPLEYPPQTGSRPPPARLSRLQTLGLRNDLVSGLASPLDSMSVYTDSDYASPVSQSYQSDDIPFIPSPTPAYSSFPTRDAMGSPAPNGSGMLERGPTSCPDNYYPPSEISSSISSLPNGYGAPLRSPVAHDRFYEDDVLGTSYMSSTSHDMSHHHSGHGHGHSHSHSHSHTHSTTSSHHTDMDAYATSAPHPYAWPAVEDDNSSQAASEDTFHMGSDPISLPSDRSPRVSFFLDYYEKIICPSMVVIDTPSNPYREHILSLAETSLSLQHAICALSACNLRMKRKHSLGQDHWQKPADLEHPRTPLSPPQSRSASDASLQEEYQHQALAVSLLNQQLSDPAKARHDGVLATLFILCHYRMCESGIAQFRTQFAGVKKILGMRESALEGSWGWMESLFTYFDGITASINDREAQLRGPYLSNVANATNPNHALENLAGCDSRLFQTIGKLGRLNLLSQHRTVQDDAAPLTRQHPIPSLRPRGLAGQALVDYYNLHAHNFDGNGFASTIDDDDIPFPAPASQISSDDLRTTFWTEWKSARLALQDWEFDSQRLMANLPGTSTPTQVRDFGYISEAFRYSALLYTERLACPSLPSSHLNFQNLVSQVLFYITSLNSNSGVDKFLLWPLFISGAECVNELQQSIVRNKCREIMGRSGYLNNLAGLEVLEKLWAEKKSEREGNLSGSGGAERIGMTNSGNGMESLSVAWGKPFRWTKFMEGGFGEWIMF